MKTREEAVAEIAGLARRFDLDREEVLQALETDNGPAPGTAKPLGVLSRVLAYLGGICILSGIGIFIALQWDVLNAVSRVLITLGTGFVAYLVGLAALTDPRFVRAVAPLFLIAAFLESTGIVVLLVEYAPAVGERPSLLLMSAVMAVQQLCTFVVWRRTVLAFTSTLFVCIGFAVLCDLLGVDGKTVGLALGIGLLCVSYALGRTPHRALAPLGYFVGSALFLLASFEWLQDTPVEIVFLGLCAAVMVLSTVVRSRSLLVVSTVAMLGYIGHLFGESLFSALALVVLGAVMIGLSALAVKLDRTYIQQ